MKKTTLLLIVILFMIFCIGANAAEKSDSGISLSDGDLSDIMKAAEDAGEAIPFNQVFDRGYYAVMMNKTEFDAFLSSGEISGSSKKTAIVPFSEGGNAKYLYENGKWSFTGFKHPSENGDVEVGSAGHYEDLIEKAGLRDYSDARIIDVPVYDNIRFLSVFSEGELRLMALPHGEESGFEYGALYSPAECEKIIKTYDFGDGWSEGGAAPSPWVTVILITAVSLAGLILAAVLIVTAKKKASAAG